MIEKINARQRISTIARQDMVTLQADDTVQQTLDKIRSDGLGERIVYFYVVNSDNKLCGVLPTRRLLAAPPDKRICELMATNIVTVPENASISEAYELLARHKLLALPIVDQQYHIVGVIDVGIFTDEKFHPSTRDRSDEVFETIGFHIAEWQAASSFMLFFIRFRWLIPTIAGGILCALLVSVYETTLSKSLVLAFFLTLVLGLGESVSMQSMTIAIHTLRMKHPTLKWYAKALWREAATALLLGAASGIVVGLFVVLTQGTVLAAAAISIAILLSICAACLFGLSIPAFLHAVRLDPKIAAGPLTLAMSDICTILLYFSIAAFLL